MDSKDALKKIGENPELAKSFEEALRNGVDEKELRGMLADAGFDADTVDELLAEWQRRRGAAIGLEHLDPDVLHKVAGGVTGPNSDCAGSWFEGDCVSTVDGTWCWSDDWCAMYSEDYTYAT